MNKKIIVEHDKYGRTVVTVRTIFPKKRKRNKIAGLERNYVTSEKRYIVTDKLFLTMKCKTVLIDARNRTDGRIYSELMQKGEHMLISARGYIMFLP